MKSIVIKEQYILEQGWPESLIGAARIVRRESNHAYKIVKQEGGYRGVPKDQVEFVSADSVDAQTPEEVKLPTNTSQLLEAAERLYQMSFLSSTTVAGRVFEVLDKFTEIVVNKDGQEEQHLFYRIQYRDRTVSLPAWCVCALPVIPLDENDIGTFVRKFGLDRYQEVMQGFSEIVKGKADGTFITRDVWEGEARYTIRKKVGKQGQITLLSKFGAHQQLPEVI